ncbi:MAG TPA: hypothetical protein VKV27_02490 [Solirubrobacteraceae bacterium]|nr:hypothetical protein [Solirubrobacteraceae bacterium]
MIVLLLTPLVIALALLCLYVARAHRRRRSLPPLRGDWWPQFERQFREYAARVREDRPQAS